MKATIEILREDFRRALMYGAVAAVLTIALAFGVAAVVGDEVENDTNRTVQVVLDESAHTRQLLCDVLIQADNPDIRDAIKENC